MLDNQFSLNDLRQAFNRAAPSYDQSTLLQRESAERLIERLLQLPINPQIILDLGAGTGYGSTLLKSYYPNADVIALDIAVNMLAGIKTSFHTVCANSQVLPFKDSSVDLIFSNMLVHWLPLTKSFYQELQRVLKPDGLLIFSTLGPDTLFELRESWQAVDQEIHVHNFIDMHHIGDVLVASGLQDPVMERESLTIHYQEAKDLLRDLQASGTSNKHLARRRSLTGKDKLTKMLEHYEQFRTKDGLIPASYELIYGIAWRGNTLKQLGEVAIPVTSIKIQSKS